MLTAKQYDRVCAIVEDLNGSSDSAFEWFFLEKVKADPVFAGNPPEAVMADWRGGSYSDES